MISRRQMLKSSSALALMASASAQSAGKDPVYDAASLDNKDLGVSSGDPGESSISLWTRVPRYGRQPQNPTAAVAVTWQLSSSSTFEDRNIIQSGTVTTDSEKDFTVNVRVNNLVPETVYYYRLWTDFGYTSQVGRTKTFPLKASKAASCRFAVVCCQQYSAGYYTAFGHIAEQAFDVILHLGDTIYEQEKGHVRPGDDPLRGEMAMTLEHYRLKHMHYLSDANLQAARRSAPWIFIWDDHEVVNDYSGVVIQVSDRKRQLGGYQAFVEYMPMNLEEVHPDQAANFKIYRKMEYGNLLTFLCLDGRQYRSEAACEKNFLAKGCDNVRNPQRSMLGHQQKEWLEDSLLASKTKWQFVVSDMVFSPLRANLFGGGHPAKLQKATFDALQDSAEKHNLLTDKITENKLGVWLTLDGWDGFTVERNQILNHIVEHDIQNVVILSGDIHANIFATLHTDEGAFAAHEIVVPSISSVAVGDVVGGLLGGSLEFLFKRYNEAIVWQDHRAHGYVAGVVTEDRVTSYFYEVNCKKRAAAQKLNFTAEIPSGSKG